MIVDVGAVRPTRLRLAIYLPLDEVMALVHRVVAALRIDVVQDIEELEVLSFVIRARDELQQRSVLPDFPSLAGHHSPAVVGEEYVEFFLLRRGTIIGGKSTRRARTSSAFTFLMPAASSFAFRSAVKRRGAVPVRRFAFPLKITPIEHANGLHTLLHGHAMSARDLLPT